MPLKVIDPRAAAQRELQDAQEAWLPPPATPVAPASGKRRRTPRKPGTELPKVPRAPDKLTADKVPAADLEYEAKLKGDFRLFLIVIWRHLLGVDPAPIMMDMAYWLQHGPDRAVLEAFRGFSKSWITGAFSLWELYVDPQRCVLNVSASLTRSAATINWCLQLIMTMPMLKHLRPLPHQRQSGKAFDVGPAIPKQAPSFNAAGLGGQTAGLRANLIVADDIETQQNSITMAMREKNREAVKEFDSIILPGGKIKYLGTPHDEDSLYNHLPSAGYVVRIWPARYPNAEQIKKYGDKLAPYITHMMQKLGPDCVGKSTMPSRFSDDDLARRELSLGKSEFALQFMLDTSLSDRDKYPLKLRDLMVLDIDPRKGPETVVWSADPQLRLKELPAMGFDGDYYHAAIVPNGTDYKPWSRVVGGIDNSGRGADEASLAITAELHGIIFWLHLVALKSGYEPETLSTFAKACVRFGVTTLRIEDNFGDGMFTALLRPVLEAEWKKHNAAVDVRNRTVNAASGKREEHGGTEIVEVKASNQMAKEKRILSLLEPLTQQHRLVVDTKVIEWDFASLKNIEGEDGRHTYAWGHQYTRLTRDRDSLKHDDRLDSLAIAVGDYAEILGVDPGTMAAQSAEDKLAEELAKLAEDDDELGIGVGEKQTRGRDAPAFRPQAR